MEGTEDTKSSIDRGLGGFRYLNLAQFGGALNDNFLKLAIIYALATYGTFSNEKEVLGLVGIAFALPFLLFLGLAGTLADKYSKSKITQYSRFAEIFIGLLAAYAFYLGSSYLLFGVALLMSAQSALFSPSKYGIIPELVGKTKISQANGYIQATTYIAIIVGTLIAPAISTLSNQNFVLMGLIASVIGLLGWFFSLGLPKTPPSQAIGALEGLQMNRASIWIWPDIQRSLRHIHKDGFLTLAVWGSAYFSFIAGFAQLNLLSYGTEHLGLQSKEASTWIFLLIALGIGAGSLVAGKLSSSNIEFGIVPIGSTILCGSSILLALIPEGSLWSGMIIALIMGVGAGLFVVPIDSFIQYRTPPEVRGEIIATAGWLAWVGILLASLLVYALPILELSAAQGFLIIGILVSLLLAASIYYLPDFFLRFFVMVITRLFYKINISGLANVPSEGPALIVANHASLIDAVCLLSSQPRRIRFVMEREYIEKSNILLRFLFGLMGVIPISTKGKPKDIIRAIQGARKALEEGYLVGIFPEGALCRTGHMLPFKEGYLRITKGVNAQIVPAYIDGVFGTRSSYAYNNPRPFAPSDFNRTLGLVYGPPLDGDTPPKELRDKVRELAWEASTLRTNHEGSLGTCFVNNAKKNWSKLAIADSSGKKLTYGKMLSGCIALGSKLSGILDSNEKAIGILLPPSVAGVIVNVTLTLQRKVSANLNYTSSQEAIISCLEIAEITTIITSKAFIEKSKFPLEEILKKRSARVIYLEDVFAQITKLEKLGAYLMAKELPTSMLTSQEGWTPDEMGTILFSSGSTSLPKGIMLSHRNIKSNIDAFSTVCRIQPKDCIAGVLPFFHSMGYTTTMWFPLLKSIKGVYHHHPLECDSIESLCQKEEVTIIVGTPTFMLGWVRKIKPEAFSKLRWACAGAEKMRPKLADMFEARFGIRPMEGYGSTECSPVISANVPNVSIDGLEQIGYKEGTAGKPMPNLKCKVVDKDTGEEVDTNQSGLLLVKGPSIMLGYINNPVKTSEVLVEGWYNTGDIVTMDEEEFITITDRLSRFSKIGGEMVSHTAVEEGIKKAIQTVVQGKTAIFAVSSVPDDKKGERLVVLYEKDLGEREELSNAVSTSDMPNLWKPNKTSWVEIEKIPILGTGKLDLAGIKKIAQTHFSDDCSKPDSAKIGP
jgi:acyl-[acyl-carrier-protein]-phospholipid O-acyltransferase/long-chain-fatty-acid--[acyl-carrier-protein] ligase